MAYGQPLSRGPDRADLPGFVAIRLLLGRLAAIHVPAWLGATAVIVAAGLARLPRLQFLRRLSDELNDGMLSLSIAHGGWRGG